MLLSIFSREGNDIALAGIDDFNLIKNITVDPFPNDSNTNRSTRILGKAG